MQPSAKSSPVILCIMDGWGLRDSTSANAVAMAATPAYDALLRAGHMQSWPLQASMWGFPKIRSAIPRSDI